ncbi:myb-like protein I isoform X2 [Condylostylus longicornis]|uniref:myb-like protein I isoform X2 n=1 Tax=Condylostylus longicornis TaxID=2530218 RepID=UPI00244E3072|nr:myb-like protein I isoform X2 [Condylostylus longicornis]
MTIFDGNCLRRIARHDEKQFSKDSLVNVMEKFVKTVNAMDETILVPCRLMDRQVGDSTDIIQVPPKTSASHQITNNINGVKKHRHQTVHEFLNSADLFNIYSMLNSLKNDLLWTRNDDDDCDIINNTNVNTIMSQISICSTTSSLNEPIQLQHQQDEQQTKITSSSTMINLQQQNGNSNIVGVNSNNNNGATQQNTNSTTTTKGHNRRPSTASMTSANSVSNLSDSESEISNENDSGMESEGNCNGSQSGGSTTGSSCGQQNLDRATELARQCRQHLAGLHRCLEQMTEAANYLTARYQSDVGPV